MIHTSDISKDFILNKAVRYATQILLKPYVPVVVKPSSTSNPCENEYGSINHLKEKWIFHSQDFLLRMANIAWDFLNILNMFHRDAMHQLLEENSTHNDN